MLWLAQPANCREPKQQKQLAAQFGVREATLTDWKHLPGFGDEVFKLSREIVKSDWLGRILTTQAEKAVYGGDTNAARFVFDSLGLMPKEEGNDNRIQILVRNVVGYDTNALG